MTIGPSACSHAEHLDQGSPYTPRRDIGASFGPDPGQPFRRRSARLRHELRHQCVGKICLQLVPADPQHTVVPCAGEERAEQRRLPNPRRPFDQHHPRHALEGFLQAATKER